ncbi:hypothetical protein [Desulfogranum japonicum]|uniref:hypothetical protein n=1 Tax=Desulfogranum japonicum TaxID=231447 RepID=UPI00048D7A5F|nr:hypothetical protein [Desulfogranum japonicum]
MLTEKMGFGYGDGVVAKSATGIGIPKTKGGCTASFSDWRYFCVRNTALLYLGRAVCGGLVPAGFLWSGMPTRTASPFFFGMEKGGLLTVPRNGAPSPLPKEQCYE